MGCPPVAAFFLLVLHGFLQPSHLLAFRIGQKFNPHLKGSYLILAKEIKSDRTGADGEVNVIGGDTHGQLQ
jgi:hypothetical protein